MKQSTAPTYDDVSKKVSQQDFKVILNVPNMLYAYVLFTVN